MNTEPDTNNELSAHFARSLIRNWQVEGMKLTSPAELESLLATKLHTVIERPLRREIAQLTLELTQEREISANANRRIQATTEQMQALVLQCEQLERQMHGTTEQQLHGTAP